MTFSKQSSNKKVCQTSGYYSSPYKACCAGVVRPIQDVFFRKFLFVGPKLQRGSCASREFWSLNLQQSQSPCFTCHLKKRTLLQSVGWEDFGKLFGFFGQFVLFLVGMSTIA